MVDEPANLPGIPKSAFTGLNPRQLGPKEGDRFCLDLGAGKRVERIVEAVDYDRAGGFTVTTRPITPEDGPPSREYRKMVRAMRKSRRRRKMRTWVGRVLGRST